MHEGPKTPDSQAPSVGAWDGFGFEVPPWLFDGLEGGWVASKVGLGQVNVVWLSDVGTGRYACVRALSGTKVDWFEVKFALAAWLNVNAGGLRVDLANSKEAALAMVESFSAGNVQGPSKPHKPKRRHVGPSKKRVASDRARNKKARKARRANRG